MTTSKNAVPLEDAEAVVFADWLRAKQIPFAHIANESRSSSRSAIVRGAKLKRMGQSAGVWDYEIFLPVENIDGEVEAYQEIRIELKRASRSLSKVSEAQKRWGDIYDKSGIPHWVCYGAEQAIQITEEALELGGFIGGGKNYD